MKVTVEVPDKDMREILKYSGEKLRGRAVLRLALNELMYRKRAAMNARFHSGEWSVDLPPVDEIRGDRNVWR
jgi:hypothetical protein